MDFFGMGVAFLLGGLVTYYKFGGPGPFEKTLWQGLHQGKKVVVCLDNEAFIFELNGNRLRISRAMADFFTEDANGNINMDTVQSSEPSNIDDISV